MLKDAPPLFEERENTFSQTAQRTEKGVSGTDVNVQFPPNLWEPGGEIPPGDPAITSGLLRGLAHEHP
ncbi:hypothetical protein ACSDR0_50005 [Streptosporangium sp. G11]|uniref:hypothetical protein n=1 Tax=Streptosporangium sp. G11 TaxID=3436926 RepID=UPI003EBEB8F8